MELSGEIVGGYFFDGVPGIQFALPAALMMLRKDEKNDGIFLLNAADPASLCGVDVPVLKQELPERFASTYLVYHGESAVILARKRGSELEIHVGPDDENLPAYIDALRSITKRAFNPVNGIKVRTINHRNAAESGYGPVFERCGFVRDYQGYTGWAL
jgi:ATP-dependent Lhr-like helicase